MFDRGDLVYAGVCMNCRGVQQMVATCSYCNRFCSGNSSTYEYLIILHSTHPAFTCVKCKGNRILSVIELIGAGSFKKYFCRVFDRDYTDVVHSMKSSVVSSYCRINQCLRGNVKFST